MNDFVPDSAPKCWASGMHKRTTKTAGWIWAATALEVHSYRSWNVPLRASG